jgi:hypothetical protein
MQRTWILAAAAVLALGLVSGLLINGCTTINAKPDGVELARERQSTQWSQGRFVNQQPMWSDNWAAISGLFKSTPDETPSSPVPVVSDGGAVLRTPALSGLRITWFGHSSALLEIDGIKVLIDP